MNDDNNGIIDKLGKIFVKFTSKFDGISEMINEKTGWNINVGMIVGLVIMAIFVIFFVKLVLGLVMDRLVSGDFS